MALIGGVGDEKYKWNANEYVLHTLHKPNGGLILSNAENFKRQIALFHIFACALVNLHLIGRPTMIRRNYSWNCRESKVY